MQPPTQGGGRKRQNLTLDLNSASAKKNRVQNLLTSPDVQMLKLTSPELEKFLSQNPTLATPTPSGYIFPKSVTEEQMMYAKGFEEALEHLRQAETVPEGSIEATVAAANTLATLSAVHPIPAHPAGPSVQINQEHQVTNLNLPLSLSLPNTIPVQKPLSRPNSSKSRTPSYKFKPTPVTFSSKHNSSPETTFSSKFRSFWKLRLRVVPSA